MRKQDTLTGLLKSAINDAPTLLGIEQATGIKRQSLATFLDGRSTLRLAAVEKLMAHFGIEARRVRKGKKS